MQVSVICLKGKAAKLGSAVLGKLFDVLTNDSQFAEGWANLNYTKALDVYLFLLNKSDTHVTAVHQHKCKLHINDIL